MAMSRARAVLLPIRLWMRRRKKPGMLRKVNLASIQVAFSTPSKMRKRMGIDGCRLETCRGYLKP